MVSKQSHVALILTSCSALAPGATAPVTFHKDIEPLLQAHCQACHRPGEIGPMAVRLSAGPHMHLRGKAMDITASYPTLANQKS
jgi:hypothetical protein